MSVGATRKKWLLLYIYYYMIFLWLSIRYLIYLDYFVQALSIIFVKLLLHFQAFIHVVQFNMLHHINLFILLPSQGPPVTPTSLLHGTIVFLSARKYKTLIFSCSHYPCIVCCCCVISESRCSFVLRRLEKLWKAFQLWSHASRRLNPKE